MCAHRERERKNIKLYYPPFLFFDLTYTHIHLIVPIVLVRKSRLSFGWKFIGMLDIRRIYVDVQGHVVDLVD